MSKLRPSLVLSVVFVLGACASAASPPPAASPSPVAGSPSPSPAASPASDGIDHPTGATDVVLRMASGGGFTIIGWAATEAPSFTLYGDGTIVARDDLAPMPDPGPDGLMRQNPFFTAQMSEGQIQDLLRYALAEGGLGIARAQYDAPVADVPTTTFTVNAGGLSKAVAINALGFETEGDPDARIKKAFVALADRLRGIARDLPISAQPYVPEHWRGVLLEAEVGQVANPAAWPWPTITTAEFTEDPTGQRPFASRVMSAAELEALDVLDLGGGIQNVGLTGPDKVKLYQLALRPLLPDESA